MTSPKFGSMGGGRPPGPPIAGSATAAVVQDIFIKFGNLTDVIMISARIMPFDTIQDGGLAEVHLFSYLIFICFSHHVLMVNKDFHYEGLHTIGVATCTANIGV